MGDYLCGQVHRWLRETKTTRQTEETTLRWPSCTRSAETSGLRSQVQLRANLYQRSRCVAQTRESSEGVTALVRGSLAPRSKKLLKYCESAILINLNPIKKK